MGKMIYLLTAIVCLNFALILIFDVNVPFASIFQLVLSPQNWNSLDFTTLVTDAITAISFAAFVGGLIFRNDLMIFAGMAGVIYGFGKNMTLVYQQLASNAFFSDSAPFVASIGTGFLSLLYIFTAIEWWRGRD